MNQVAEKILRSLTVLIDEEDEKRHNISFEETAGCLELNHSKKINKLVRVLKWSGQNLHIFYFHLRLMHFSNFWNAHLKEPGPF